jgi:hypothetical protein
MSLSFPAKRGEGDGTGLGVVCVCGGACDGGDPEQGPGGDGTSPVQLKESPGG